MLKFLALSARESFPLSIYLGLIEMRLSSITKFFVALSCVGVITTASAGYRHNYNYSQCGGSSTQTDAAECNSPLGENVYNLVDHGIFESTSANLSTVSIGGIDVAVSGWADTFGHNDDIVIAADTYKISDKYGYGITNEDWESTYNSPDHAIDNVNTRHHNLQDFDFVLFSFSDDVTLQGANFSWVFNQYDTQVSVAALENISALTSGSKTWSDIAGNAITSSYNVEKCDSTDEHLQYKSEFAFNTSSRYWLVGAYNTVFGDIGGKFNNDAFKLTSVGFSVTETNGTPDTTEVSEPGTMGLLMACSLFVIWRRKKLV